MRVGLIGCGSIGARHARNVAALGHEPVLCDTSYDRVVALGGELGAVTGKQVRTIAGDLPSDEPVDAVMICTPASTHAAVARDVQRRGYRGPLFVEKPLALSVEECDVFTHWPHPTTMVGYNLRCHAEAQRLKAWPNICGGDVHLRCDMRQWPGVGYADPLLECSHELDLALWMGAATTVTAASRRADRASIDLGQWLVTVNWDSARYLRMWAVRDAKFKGVAVELDSPEDLGDEMYVEELRHFLDCAAKGTPTETPFTDGIRVLDVIEQAQQLAAVPA